MTESWAFKVLLVEVFGGFCVIALCNSIFDIDLKTVQVEWVLSIFNHHIK